METFSDKFANLKNSELFNDAKKLTNSEGNETKLNIPSSSKSKLNAVLVNPKQRGNPLLKSICNVPWEFDESIIPDYVMGRTTCALFLSLRYHNQKQDYINERLKELGRLYDLRVLLVQVDMEDPHFALKHLTRVCLIADLTLMLAWNAQEAGKIIETYKIYENKPPDMIMERQEQDPQLKVINALTSIRSINKTDATTLLTTFGSLKKIINASKETLTLCPGLGPQKAARLYNALRQPVLKSDKVKVNSPQKNITDFLKK